MKNLLELRKKFKLQTFFEISDTKMSQTERNLIKNKKQDLHLKEEAQNWNHIRKKKH